MKYAIKRSFVVCIVVCGAMIVGSCGGRGGLDSRGGNPSSAAGAAVVSDFPQKIGEPYQVGESTYTPQDISDYDDVGFASYYGAELAGRPTANGEIFDPAAISGAHKTLPLPSYVEVTALDTGKTILVRINDRGPFAKDRVIDLSQGAAQQLGIQDQGVAGVRVRKVNPPEQERAALRGGSKAAERIDTPESLLKVLRGKLAVLPKPAATRVANSNAVPAVNPAQTDSAAGPAAVTAPTTAEKKRDDRFVRENGGARVNTPTIRAPVTATAKVPARQAAASRSGQAVAAGNGGFVREDAGRPAVEASAAVKSGYIVQIASFSSRSRAAALARQLGGMVAISADGGLFRVRYGPFASDAEAQTALAKARQRGYPQAKIFRE